MKLFQLGNTATKVLKSKTNFFTANNGIIQTSSGHQIQQNDIPANCDLLILGDNLFIYDSELTRILPCEFNNKTIVLSQMYLKLYSFEQISSFKILYTNLARDLGKTPIVYKSPNGSIIFDMY